MLLALFPERADCGQVHQTALRRTPPGRRIIADQSLEKPNAYEDHRKSWCEEDHGQAGQCEAECPSEAAAALEGTGRRSWRRSPLPWRSGQQGVGIHQEEQPAEPGKQARDPRGRQAAAGVRQEEGDDVRDEQAPGPALEISAAIVLCSRPTWAARLTGLVS